MSSRALRAAVLGVAISLATVPVAATAAQEAGTQQAATERIDLNTASVEQLMGLKGVGEVTARAIVDYREQNGPFRSVDDLVRVRGIGEKKLEALRPFVKVE
ncbi:MAG: helix-hairpin-helix domain-containing protein [Deltaproteobacteria bacterium]|nr:helix-hairpin-helix domain-containing protein [Deltaproteobacteria bacterium]